MPVSGSSRVFPLLCMRRDFRPAVWRSKTGLREAPGSRQGGAQQRRSRATCSLRLPNWLQGGVNCPLFLDPAICQTLGGLRLVHRRERVTEVAFRTNHSIGTRVVGAFADRLGGGQNRSMLNEDVETDIDARSRRRPGRCGAGRSRRGCCTVPPCCFGLRRAALRFEALCGPWLRWQTLRCEEASPPSSCQASRLQGQALRAEALSAKRFGDLGLIDRRNASRFRLIPSESGSFLNITASIRESTTAPKSPRQLRYEICDCCNSI